MAYLLEDEDTDPQLMHSAAMVNEPRRSSWRPALKKASIEAQQALSLFTEGGTKVGKETLVSRLNQKTTRRAASNRKLGQWIYAGEFQMVGMRHQQFATMRMEASLQPGAIVDLEREPKNVHDAAAIAIHYEGERIGYIRKEQNTLLSAVLDLGLRGRAELGSFDVMGTKGIITIKVYLTKGARPRS